MDYTNKRILIANRGEIAVRIIATCKKLGIKTIAVFTDGEETLPHVVLADHTENLGRGPLKNTYLAKKRLLEVAKKHQADAIHPGYGFLSENADFAAQVKEAGFIWVGAPASIIEKMGDKATARTIAKQAGLPIIPGDDTPITSLNEAQKIAKKLTFPLLLKAAAGGGGKGMRLVKEPTELEQVFKQAQEEAKNSFADDRLLLEHYISEPHHIEIQILSDQHNNHLHLYERECSIQRRYQKIIEETPSPTISPSLRKTMTEQAVSLAKQVGYEGAGTIECIVDGHGNWYFLEMNTRLQVEHPITEAVTGIDLVEQQIRIAFGEKLNLKQNAIKSQGHAIEARLYAENPDNHFLPTTGFIEKIGKTKLRFDCGYEDHSEVTTMFDPMLGKLISHADSRKKAIDQLQQGLHDLQFLGIHTNKNYLSRILQHQAFIEGKTDTHFLEKHQESLSAKAETSDKIAHIIAAFYAKQQCHTQIKESYSPWNSNKLIGFRLHG